jgi:phage nucleotide-binding protein
MTIKLQSTKHVATLQGVKVMVYGKAGVGKTSLIATMPRPVIFSAEKGLLSLRQFNIPYQVIETYKDLVECYEWTTKSNEAKQFDSLALDSVSEIAEIVLTDLKSKTKDPRKAYGEVQELVVSIMRDFRDLNQKHVYFSAKEETVKDGITGAIIARPMMPGQKLPEAVPYLFDELFRMQVYTDPTTNKQERMLQTQVSAQADAKDRSGTLDIWEVPDFNSIFKKIITGTPATR